MQVSLDGELGPAVDDDKRCKKNSPSVSSYRDKRKKEYSDHGSKVGTVHRGRGGERPVLVR